MIRNNLLAALMGVAFGAGMAPAPKLSQPPVYRRPTSFGRSRIPGKPGRAGDKLARMAAESRLGVGCPK